jgi:hypothetical protein
VQDDLIELFGKAITCVVLGKAGPQRFRVMALLYKDERLNSLDQLPKYASHSTVLSKMLKEQILKQEELKTFESFLMPHQKAVFSSIFTFFTI